MRWRPTLSTISRSRSPRAQIGATFKALLEGRWDDARHTFVAASRTIDGMQGFRVKALFQLAVGHLAGERFPEAAEGLREAEAFFEERGAGGCRRGIPGEGRQAVTAVERRGQTERQMSTRGGSSRRAGLDDATDREPVVARRRSMEARRRAP